MFGRNRPLAGWVLGGCVLCAMGAWPAPAAGEMVVDSDLAIDYQLTGDVTVVAGCQPGTTLDIVYPALIFGTVRVTGCCVLNMTGGSIHESAGTDTVLQILGQGVGNILGGTVADEAQVDEFGVLNVFGGYVGDVDADGSGTLNVFGGMVLSPDVSGLASMNLYGGTVPNATAAQGGTIDIYGGRVQTWLRAGYVNTDQAVIRVYGSGFNYPYGPIADASGRLTGLLESGEPINVTFDISPNSAIILVPEPAATALLGLAFLPALIARRRRRR